MLTQEKLKSLLHYNLETGVFTRLVTSGRSKKGDVVGFTNGRGWLRAKVGGDGKQYKLHRLAFLYVEGDFPPDQVDHINGVRDDNRWCNLRKATHYQNAVNRVNKGNSKTGYVGVVPSGSKYKARNQKGGKVFWSRSYSCPKEASKEYKRVANKLHGEFFKG